MPDNHTVTREMKSLVAALFMSFENQEDEFLSQVASNIVDDTWPEGTPLSADAWFSLRLATIRVIGRGKFLVKDGAGEADTRTLRYLREDEDQVDYAMEVVESLFAPTEDTGEESFQISEVFGNLAYEF